MSIYIPGCPITGITLGLFLGPPFLWKMSLWWLPAPVVSVTLNGQSTPRPMGSACVFLLQQGPSDLTTHRLGNSTLNSFLQWILHVVFIRGSHTHRLSVRLPSVTSCRSKPASHQQQMLLSTTQDFSGDTSSLLPPHCSPHPFAPLKSEWPTRLPGWSPFTQLQSFMSSCTHSPKKVN